MAKRIVIDLEMCNVPKLYRNRNYRYATEIIQIGAVMMDENNEIVDKFSSFVKPAYGIVDNFIKSLTGIKGANVKTARPIDAVVREMLTWIGTQDVRFYSWSDNDYYQFRRELRTKGFEADEFSVLMDQNNWVDYQQVFESRFNFGRVLSLKDALFYVELDPNGRMHDGLMDAVNTARLIAEMERNPEKRFLADRISQIEQDVESFGTSMGCLLKGINLQIA